MNLGKILFNLRFTIPELSLLASSQPAESAPEAKTTTKAPVKEEKQAKKEEPKEEEEDAGMGGLFDWFWNQII